MEKAMQDRYEVVVVGGGAAGLSGALTLSRARRSVLVVDAGSPRNAPADAMHAYLGRDGMPPAQLLAVGRGEVESYGGQVVTDEVVTARRKDGAGFEVMLAGGRLVRADRLLVTSGLVDELPEVAGLAQRWGREVLHCPYCHGWEVRDEPIAVLSTSPLAVHQALLWRQWSKDVTLFTHTGPVLTDEQREQLAARDITVVDGGVSQTVVRNDTLTGLRLEDGRVIDCRAVVVTGRMSARAGFLAELGLEPAPLERDGYVFGTHIPADSTGATAVPGVWAAGNVTSPLDQVIMAAAGGARAAMAINTDLVDEESRRALADRRGEVKA
ncbi:NAD(P)/FAD-dependent oxidoreductase [Actinoplanes sp. NPDC023936]|uniref:NAD(P)/FAD-dependent oxidoreductase n=1 Tax=Actinoplanes sp. NPDC023936 TaxID=3154910 RepID=UPI0033CE091B